MGFNIFTNLYRKSNTVTLKRGTLLLWSYQQQVLIILCDIIEKLTAEKLVLEIQVQERVVKFNSKTIVTCHIQKKKNIL